MNQSQIEVVEHFSDPRWRMNNLYWIVDESGKKIPFRLNGTQLKLMDDLWYFNLILKSRQHGITTVVDIMGLDQALFNDNFSVGICAHTREDVEKIFRTKVKFPYDNLPEGLKNARGANTDTAKMLVFANQSSIEVATSLRSGTYQFAHVSEFGKICAKYPEKAKEIVTGTFETIHPGSYLFVESTAEGRDGYFYRYVTEAIKRQQMGDALNKLQFKLHFFAWFEDPKNKLDAATRIPQEYEKYFTALEKEHGIILNQEQKIWYATKAQTLEDDIKREHPSTVDEAFEAAISGAILSKQMAFLRKNGRITEVPHDPALPVNTGWDFGLRDRMCIWFHQYVGLQHRIIDYMVGTDDDVLYYWREMQRKPYIWGHHYLPHDAGARRIGTAKSADQKPKTLEQILNAAGMRNTHIVPVVPNKWTAIQEVKLFMPGCWISINNCEDGILGLDNFKKEWDETAGDWKNQPVHDWAMHPYDAIESLVRGISAFGCAVTAPKTEYQPEATYQPSDAEIGM
jgi:hypothetical protein